MSELQLTDITGQHDTPHDTGERLRSFDESLPMALMRARESVMRRYCANW